MAVVFADAHSTPAVRLQPANRRFVIATASYVLLFPNNTLLVLILSKYSYIILWVSDAPNATLAKANSVQIMIIIHTLGSGTLIL